MPPVCRRIRTSSGTAALRVIRRETDAQLRVGGVSGAREGASAFAWTGDPIPPTDSCASLSVRNDEVTATAGELSWAGDRRLKPRLTTTRSAQRAPPAATKSPELVREGGHRVVVRREFIRRPRADRIRQQYRYGHIAMATPFDAYLEGVATLAVPELAEVPALLVARTRK